jgi:Transglutaminase-like superfamily
MRPYSISPHVRWCGTEHGIILLDLNTGRYLGISHADRCKVAPFVNDWSVEPESAADLQNGANGTLTSLLNAGILCSASRHEPSPQPQLPVAQDSIPFEDVLDAPRVHTIDLARLIAAYARVRFSLKRRSMQRIVSRIGERKRRSIASASAEPATVSEVAKRYLNLRPLVLTARDRCLLDSLVMIEYLSMYHVFPDWVIGVRTQPFGAHSWVQNGSVVLNDTPEKVSSFTPILAV